ncbi:MAG: heavy metal-associated domain-containing protein [Candidatus Scalindua sp.]|nr:heavy metal-associated domain-containing protein [Candidatus Scalindua sp.]
MFKALRLSSIIFLAVMFIFTLSFSALQAGVVTCCDELCEEEVCPMKEAKAELTEADCGVCEDTEKSCSAEDVAQHAADVVLNIRGMTCAGSECRVKDALSAFEGVSDVNVNYKDGNAHLHVEEGKVDNAALIEALRQVGFLASEG